MGRILRGVLAGVGALVVLGVVFVGGLYGGLRLRPEQGPLPPQLGPPCRLADASRVGDALDRRVTLQSGAGFGGLIAGTVDDRVLAAAPTCVGTSIATATRPDSVVVRIAVLDAAGAPAAASAYRDEATHARAASPSWYAADVTGLGDQAFCTAPSPGGSVGVLARHGVRLVYASVAGGPVPADAATSGCRAAAAVASVALGG